MSENRLRMEIGPHLLMEISDFTDLPQPIISLSFMPIGEKITLPGFTVGVPLEVWHAMVHLLSEFEPKLKRA